MRGAVAIMSIQIIRIMMPARGPQRRVTVAVVAVVAVIAVVEAVAVAVEVVEVVHTCPYVSIGVHRNASKNLLAAVRSIFDVAIDVGPLTWGH